MSELVWEQVEVEEGVGLVIHSYGYSCLEAVAVASVGSCS